MKNKILKRLLPLTMSIMMLLPASLGMVFAETDNTGMQQEVDITVRRARAAVGVMLTVADSADVHGGSSVKVKATWNESGNLPLLATISVTNGAKILSEDKDDILFTSDDGFEESSIKNLDVARRKEAMTFITGDNYAGTKSSVEFEVEAPLGSRSFDVNVFFGKEDGTSLQNQFNSATGRLNVISGLSVEVRNSDGEEITQVDDYNQIYLTGMAWYRGTDAPANTAISLIISNKATGEVVGEYEDVGNIVNREYKYGPIVMPTKFADGTYLVTATMVHKTDNDYVILGTSTTEFNFKKLPDVFEVALYSQIPDLRFSQSFVKPNSEPQVVYNNLPVSATYYASRIITASVQFKNASNIVSSQFIVNTNYGRQIYAGSKSGNLVFANLPRIRSNVFISGSTKPYVECEVTYRDGTKEVIYVGSIIIFVDPSGIVYDGETGAPIEGATCTLYTLNEEADWVLWEDFSGVQANPVTTGTDGKYAWDVQDGKYDVRMYHPDYFENEDQFYSTLLDPRYGILEVPPEQTNIDVELFKPGSGGGVSTANTLLDNLEFEFIPAHQDELEEAIESKTSLTINVAEEDLAFYLTKDQVQSMLDNNVKLVVNHGDNIINIDNSVLEMHANAIRAHVCFLIADL